MPAISESIHSLDLRPLYAVGLSFTILTITAALYSGAEDVVQEMSAGSDNDFDDPSTEGSSGTESLSQEEQAERREALGAIQDLKSGCRDLNNLNDEIDASLKPLEDRMKNGANLTPEELCEYERLNEARQENEDNLERFIRALRQIRLTYFQ